MQLPVFVKVTAMFGNFTGVIIGGGGAFLYFAILLELQIISK